MIDVIINFLNGASAFGLIIASWAFFIWCIIQYKKTKTSTFLNGMILTAAISLGWTGITITFLNVLLYNGYNIPELTPIINIFSYSTIPFGALDTVNVTWDLAGGMKSKKYFLLLFAALMAGYYTIFYFSYISGEVIITVPASPPQYQILDDYIAFNTPFFYMIYFIIIVSIIIAGIGFFKFLKQAAGELKKRSVYILIAAPLLGIAIMADTVVLGTLTIIPNFMDLLWIVRIMVALAIFLIYLGFRPK